MDGTEEEKKLMQALQPVNIAVPRRCDEAVLAGIAQKAAEIRAGRRRRRHFFARGAMAATVLLALAISLLSPLVVGPAAKPENPDIVHVYLLACKIEEGKAVLPQDDFNGDGRVDSLDVEDMARRVVAISS